MQGGKRTAAGVNVAETKFWIPQTFSYKFNNNNATQGLSPKILQTTAKTRLRLLVEINLTTERLPSHPMVEYN